MNESYDKSLILEAQADNFFKGNEDKLYSCRNLWREAAEYATRAISEEQKVYDIKYREKHGLYATIKYNKEHVERISHITTRVSYLYLKARDFTLAYKNAIGALEVHKKWEGFKLTLAAMEYLKEVIKNSPPTATFSYVVQDGCWNCKHCFARSEYDEGDSYYCTFDAPKRPLCLSVAMGETTRDIEGESREKQFKKFHITSDKWMKWSEKRDVSREGKCDSYERDE